MLQKPCTINHKEWLCAHRKSLVVVVVLVVVIVVVPIVVPLVVIIVVVVVGSLAV